MLNIFCLFHMNIWNLNKIIYFMNIIWTIRSYLLLLRKTLGRSLCFRVTFNKNFEFEEEPTDIYCLLRSVISDFDDILLRYLLITYICIFEFIWMKIYGRNLCYHIVALLENYSVYSILTLKIVDFELYIHIWCLMIKTCFLRCYIILCILL